MFVLQKELKIELQSEIKEAEKAKKKKKFSQKNFEQKFRPIFMVLQTLKLSKNQQLVVASGEKQRD